ncbi:50S ribosomal protein L3 N(5)-glutamine methyltransferase [Alkalimarinus sediminis]|uniref:Ribosomal protein uL3 glutamine methyltransferase n=1 Tax=Alkalimarinus sediminis TaxID=1632866 RepID=A0A9E8HKD7_9ALTE|nr:50S ribosomal protein L3 N(5)-glutamine methyltransferase [Alkalimarinus sediminis]UZW76044.1 50S ribosomal protein L3 N(5)-glutamine methyltransferase [Alkalimarinus sediminis]
MSVENLVQQSNNHDSRGVLTAGTYDKQTIDTEALFSDEVTGALSTIRDYIRYAISCFNQADVFYGHGTDNSWDEAVQLVLNTVHLPWDMSDVVMDSHLTQAERALILAKLRSRVVDRVPSAYLMREAWFMGLPFYVDERVLVPRSPIAELIENGFQPWLNAGPITDILDLCTGSGCIGIASALVFPDADVDLVDLSKDALDVAAINIKKHDLSDRVKLIQSDVFEHVTKRYQVIVSNPPYVDAKDISEMPQEFHNEPQMGLAAGPDGLDIVRKILARARQHLTNDGILIVETGNSWAALELAYPDVPFTWIEFEHGGHGVFIITAEELDQYQAQLS